MYDFLLVINTNLHRFRDIVFNSFKIAIFGYTLLAFNPLPDEGVSLKLSPYDFQRMSTDGQGTKWRRNIAQNFNRLSRAHERYSQTDRRTDGR